jgi:hypothetical protein
VSGTDETETPVARATARRAPSGTATVVCVAGASTRRTISSAGVKSPIAASENVNRHEVAPASLPLMNTGDPDMPAKNPCAASRNEGGPVISNITRSWPGRIASWSVPMTSNSKLVGVLPRTVVRPVPVIPGTMSAAGITAGGSGHETAAGAGVAANIVATNVSDRTAAGRVRNERGRTDMPYPLSARGC